MDKKIGRVVWKEALIFLIVMGLCFSCATIAAIYDNNLLQFRDRHNITLIFEDGRRWGVFSPSGIPEEDGQLTEVFDLYGNRKGLGSNRQLRPLTFDIETARAVDASLSLAERKIQSDEFHKQVMQRKGLISQALKADKRAAPIILILTICARLLIGGYLLYVLIRLGFFWKQTIKDYGFKGVFVGIKRFLRRLFEKETLIRVILVLGIILVAMLILKSCHRHVHVTF